MREIPVFKSADKTAIDRKDAKDGDNEALKTMRDSIDHQSENFKKYFTLPKYIERGRGDPVDALRAAFMSEDVAGAVIEPVAMSPFVPESTPQEILLSMLQRFFNGAAAVRSTDAAPHEQNEAFADACMLMIECALRKDDQGVQAFTEKAESIFGRLRIPAESRYAFVRDCVAYVASFNDRIRSARTAYFTDPGKSRMNKAEEGGDLLNVRESGRDMLRNSLDMMLLAVGEKYPPPVQSEFLKKGIETGAVIPALVEETKRRFLERWNTTSGYASIEEFRADLRSFQAPIAMRKIAQKLRSGDFYIRANVRTEDLPLIRKSGLKNLHETGDGTFTRDGGDKDDHTLRRFKLEAGALGLKSPTDLLSVSPSDRIKHLSVAGGSLRKARSEKGNTDYGRSVVGLRAADVKDRMFLTIGDSGRIGFSADANWDQCPIPLEYADVIAPFIYDRLLRTGKIPFLFSSDVGSVLVYHQSQSSSMRATLPAPFAGKLRHSTIINKSNLLDLVEGQLRFDYVEAQVLGPITPELFEFEATHKPKG